MAEQMLQQPRTVNPHATLSELSNEAKEAAAEAGHQPGTYAHDQATDAALADLRRRQIAATRSDFETLV